MNDKSDKGNLSRRHLLQVGTSLTCVATAGCMGLGGDDGETNEAAPSVTRTETTEGTSPSTRTPGESDIREHTFAARVDYWAWFPKERSLWSRSVDPYDFQADDGRWLAGPTADGGVFCRVENDAPPGNAGVYFDIGPIGKVGSLTIDAETVRSDGTGDQQLLYAIYFDSDGDDEYFQWDPHEDRERFDGLGNDLETLGGFPSDEGGTIEDDTELDLVPPSEDDLVTFGEVKRGVREGIDPLTPAAIQVSVMGSGDGNVEDAIVHDVRIEVPEVAADGSWPMFSHDRLNSGHDPVSSGPTDGVEPRWEFETDAAVRSSPAVVEGTVYVGSDDGHVYAIDAATGEQQWAYRTGGAVVSSPAVFDHVVYVGSNDHHLHAVSAETGEKLWSFETGGSVRSPSTVQTGFRELEYADVVGFGSDDGSVYHLNAVTGEELGTVDTDGPVVAAPAMLRNGRGYWESAFGSTDGTAYYWSPRYDRYDDEEKENFTATAEVGSPIHASMSITDVDSEDVWYRAEDAGELHKRILNRGNMETIWRFDADGRIRTTPVLANELVYVGSHDGNIYGIDRESGARRWAFGTGGRVDSSPAVADGSLYVGSADQQVYALDADAGDRLWAFESGDAVVSSPAVVDGTVYIGSTDGTVYALAEP